MVFFDTGILSLGTLKYSPLALPGLVLNCYELIQFLLLCHIAAYNWPYGLQDPLMVLLPGKVWVAKAFRKWL